LDCTDDTLQQCRRRVNQLFLQTHNNGDYGDFLPYSVKPGRLPDRSEDPYLPCAAAGIFCSQMNAPEQPSDKFLDIRKYPNRRYYDATHSRHLTLEEIRSLISEGFDIKVTDSKTGTDITALVLTQILLELETPKIANFPVALLLRVIRSNDHLVRDFVETYFNQAFRVYSEYQKQMDERMRQMQGVSGMFPPFGAWSQAVMSPFATPFGPNPPPPEESSDSAQASTPSAEEKDLRNMVGELQQQLAAMQAELKARKPRNR